jgi:hypothetical protein
MISSPTAPQHGRAPLRAPARGVYDRLVAELLAGQHRPGDEILAAAIVAASPDPSPTIRVAQEAIDALVEDGWLMRIGGQRAARAPGGQDPDAAAEIRWRISVSRLRPGDLLRASIEDLIGEHGRLEVRRQLERWGLTAGEGWSATVAENAAAVIWRQDGMLERALDALRGPDPELGPGAPVRPVRLFGGAAEQDVSPPGDVAWVMHALFGLGLIAAPATGSRLRPGAAWLVQRMDAANSK